jgi:hypothetical protein
MAETDPDAGAEPTEAGAQSEQTPSGTAESHGAIPEPSTSEQAGPTTAADESGADGQGAGGKAKVAAVAAGAGAAVAGIAGGIAVAARDTRRRVLGVPIGKRSRFQRGASSVVGGASSVVGKVKEPAERISSRRSKD